MILETKRWHHILPQEIPYSIYSSFLYSKYCVDILSWQCFTIVFVWCCFVFIVCCTVSMLWIQIEFVSLYIMIETEDIKTKVQIHLKTRVISFSLFAFLQSSPLSFGHNMKYNFIISISQIFPLHRWSLNISLISPFIDYNKIVCAY